MYKKIVDILKKLCTKQRERERGGGRRERRASNGDNLNLA